MHSRGALVLVTAIAAVTACRAPQPPAPAIAMPPSPSATAAAPGDQVSLADVGLEAASLDRSTDPCVDFYQFACGGWIAKNPAPADHGRWMRFSEVDDHNLAQLKLLLEATPTSQVGAYYASCMDTATIDRAGTTAIAPLLAKTAAVAHERGAWQGAIAALHAIGVPVVWQVASAADFKDSQRAVTVLDAAGLGLPDRDYYLKPEFAPKLAAYTAHVGRMLALVPTTGGSAADVVAIETAIARATKTAVDKRDIPASYNPMTTGELARLAPGVAWPAYFAAVGFTPSKKLVVGTPKFFAGVDALHAKFAPAAWSAYFTYQLLAATAFALPHAFDDELFTLTQQLRGVEHQRERYQRCIDQAGADLGELLGQLYVTSEFPASAKDTAQRLVDAMLHVMADQISKLEWMSEMTKQLAQAKLAKLVRMVGFPDTWRTYPFSVTATDFAGNLLRASAFEAHRVLAKSGQPVDRGEWFMNAFRVDAYYDPSTNSTALPAGILQPPFFGRNRSIAANLGGVGMVIGHEITHAFDDQGAQFDAVGNLANWWQTKDKTEFASAATCVADQYSTFEAAPKQFVQGRLTLGEDIADLGGVKLAFAAYRSLRAGAPPTVADGFTEDQQFFIAVAQSWCATDHPDEVQRLLTIDPHAPTKFRVYGALRNFDEFATAFACAPGTPMRPANTCRVW